MARTDSFARCALKSVLDKVIHKPRPTSLGDVSGRCIIPKTETGRPYVALFHNGTLGCAVGCNGYAAKSSDELGRLAARMVATGRDDAWGDAIPADAFAPVFEDDDHVLR